MAFSWSKMRAADGGAARSFKFGKFKKSRMKVAKKVHSMLYRGVKAPKLKMGLNSFVIKRGARKASVGKARKILSRIQKLARGTEFGLSKKDKYGRKNIIKRKLYASGLRGWRRV